MNPRMLDHYNRELQHLREMAGEFAAEYPKIAGRLALDGFECGDPYVERLLEGFAFLAARVQLKFDSGHARFTQHLLETVYPDFLAPLPSMAVAQFEPDLRDPNLARGYAIPRHTSLRGRAAPDEQTACEYRTAHEVKLWPIALEEANYLPGVGELAAHGVTQARGAVAGIRLCFSVGAGLRAADLDLDRLVLFLPGSSHLPGRLYEQMLGNGIGMAVRPRGVANGRQTFLDASHIHALGFDDSEALLPNGRRSFSGYRLLREYFAFPSRYLFIELAGLRQALAHCSESGFEIVVLLDRSESTLERAVSAADFALNCTPAINLFPRRADRVLLNDRDAEHHVVADRTRPMDFEVHSVLGVTGHGAAQQQTFRPFYAAGSRSHAPGEAAYYTLHRVPRLSSARQRRKGGRSSYVGDEVYVSIVDAQEAPYRRDLRELSLDVLCTNRDLPILMPVGGMDDFSVDSGAPLRGVRCIAGPTRPRETAGEGEAHWHLINLLSLNYLSLLDSEDDGGAQALRDLLSIHADTRDPAMRKQIEGLRGVSHRAITRRLPSPGPVSFGRGLEITLNCEERAFEGSGAFLFGAVMEQFFARYVSINSFTETVLRSSERGEVMRWTSRTGRRQIC